MMKLPKYDGRELVPVRLIPLIANAWLGRVALSGILANRVNIGGWPYPSDDEQFQVNVYDEKTGCTELTTKTRAELIGPRLRDNGFYAYHFNDEGKPVKMRPSEWEAIYRDITVLEPVFRKREDRIGVPDSMESVWRLKTTIILPPGVFLWRDDLDQLWQAHIATFTTDTRYDSPNFRKMNYDAYIRPEYRKLVLKGFEHLMQSNNQIDEQLIQTDQMPLLEGQAETLSQSIIDENLTDTPTNNEQEPAQTENTPTFDIDEFIESHCKAINCPRPKCDNCKKHVCRNQLAHDLFTNYGDHTPYRVHLWKIGIALGLPSA